MYGFTGSQTTQQRLVDGVVAAEIGGLFVTTQQVYTAWSTLWAQFCSSINSAWSLQAAHIATRIILVAIDRALKIHSMNDISSIRPVLSYLGSQSLKLLVRAHACLHRNFDRPSQPPDTMFSHFHFKPHALTNHKKLSCCLQTMKFGYPTSPSQRWEIGRRSPGWCNIKSGMMKLSLHPICFSIAHENCWESSLIYL